MEEQGEEASAPLDTDGFSAAPSTMTAPTPHPGVLADGFFFDAFGFLLFFPILRIADTPGGGGGMRAIRIRISFISVFVWTLKR